MKNNYFTKEFSKKSGNALLSLQVYLTEDCWVFSYCCLQFVAIHMYCNIWETPLHIKKKMRVKKGKLMS